MSGPSTSTPTTSVFNNHSDVTSTHLQAMTDDAILAHYAAVLPSDSFMKLSSNQGTLIRDFVLLLEPLVCSISASTSSSPWHHSGLPKYSLATDKDLKLITKPGQNVTVKNTSKSYITVYRVLKVADTTNPSQKVKTYDYAKTVVQPGTHVTFTH
jgi:hypothetical protein